MFITPGSRLGTALQALLRGSFSFTGSPTVPTPSPGSNNKQIANTAFVSAAINAVPILRAAVIFTQSGGVVTIVKSFNVSGVTRSSAGQYVVNITSTMPDANYYVSVTSDVRAIANTWGTINTGSGGSGKTTTACPVGFLNGTSGATNIDPGGAHVLIFA